MGKLMKLETWRKKRFSEEDVPTRNTVLAWIAKGQVPAKRYGRQWYIDVEVEQNTTGDDLVDSVLQAAD